MSKFLFKRFNGLNENRYSEKFSFVNIIPACTKNFVFLDRFVINKQKTMNNIRPLYPYNNNQFGYGYFTPLR